MHAADSAINAIDRHCTFVGKQWKRNVRLYSVYNRGYPTSNERFVAIIYLATQHSATAATHFKQDIWLSNTP